MSSVRLVRLLFMVIASCALLATVGCAAPQKAHVEEELPLSHYEEVARTEAARYTLIDDYSYGGVTLLDPVPSAARPAVSKAEDDVQVFRLDEVEAPFDFAILEAAEGRVVDLTLVKAFETKQAARSFFGAAYAAMARKYSKLISPVSNGKVGDMDSFTMGYWSFSRSQDWIEHVAKMRKSRADMVWLYQGRGYEPSSAISEVLNQAAIGLHSPEGTGQRSYHVAVSYKTHVRRELASDARKDLIDNLDL
jgi:hypothetical protein